MTTRMAVLALLLPCSGAFAGTTLTMKNAKGGESTLFLDRNKMRTVDARPEKSESSMMYDGDAQKMFLIDPAKKTYTVITPARMKAKMDEARASMKASMAKMPAEQRAQMQAAMEKMDPETRKRMEAMMSGQAARPATPAQKTRYEKTGSSQTVAGYRCEGYRQVTGDKVGMAGCFIPWSAGAVSKEDLGSFEKIREFMREGGQGMMDGAAMLQVAEMPGFPAKWGPPGKEGSDEARMTLVSIKRGSVPADTFKVPAGYAEKDFGEKEER